MKKRVKFIADTAVSVTVALAGGAHRRVSFSPLSDGRSVFYTDDKDIIAGLRRHYRYKRLFREDKEADETEKAEDVQVKEALAKEPLKVKVADIMEAKDYLADNFGLIRTKLRGEDKILAAAREHGIEFEIG